MRQKFLNLSLWAKIMLAMCSICVICLVSMWVSATILLQPAYNRHIHQTLSLKVDRLGSLFDEAYLNGEEISRRTLTGLSLNSDFWSRVNDQISNGRIRVDSCCVDIADSTLTSVNYVENLQPCQFHKKILGVAPFSSLMGTTDRNSAEIISLRKEIFENGSAYRILEAQDGSRQMAVGKLVGGGQYTVVVSMGLASVDEAGLVMGRILPLLTLIILILSLIFSGFLSRRVIRPLTRMSAAARKIADGDYDVTVEETEGNDELTLLARDFNHMAQQVRQSNLQQQQLLANVSHDLRTPLTLIKGYAETVRDITGEDKARRDEQMEIIIDEADRLSGLVNSVMEFSKVSSGTEKPEKVRFDMSQLCEEVAERYEGICTAKGYTLWTSLQSAMVYADPGMMERVLHNLLGNAMHHIGEDGWFGLSVMPLKNGGCRVEISDHGPGIKQEDLPHIFDRYYRSRSDTGKTGTGLGLSITKAIFQSHDFRYGVDSEPGKGSRFWFIMTDQK